jgi:hypothetical protein
MNHRPLLAMLILAVLPRGAHAADSWKFRPGLWEITSTQTFTPRLIPPTLPPEQQAQMRAFREKLKPPQPFTEQFCVDEKSQQMKSMFDPANQPPGICSEKVIAESGEAREIEDDCNIPLQQFKDVNPPPGIPVRSTRHIQLTGEGAGTIDRSEIAMHRPNESLTQNFRWLAAECGTVKAAPQN